MTREFTVDGKKHVVVFEGDAAFIDADRAAADVQKIVEAGEERDGLAAVSALLLPRTW